MTLSRNVNSGIVVASVLVLSACGGGSDSNPFSLVSENLITTVPVAPEPDVVDSVPLAPEPDTVDSVPFTPEPDSVDSAALAPEPDAVDSVPSAQFSPAEFILSECGSLVVSDAVPTNSLSAPTRLTVGVPARGQVISGSPTQNFHTWEVTLEPGNYHFVADGSGGADGEEGTQLIGIQAELLGTTTADNVDLGQAVDIGFDVRLYQFLEIVSTQTFLIRIEPSFTRPLDYTFGIFPNGTAVPTPFIERCLPVETISVDSPQSIVLGEPSSRENDRFFAIDLESGEFLLSASATSVESRLLGYTFDLLSEFGQTNDIETITEAAEVSTALVTGELFEVDSGSFFLRLRNRFDNNNPVEFTISVP